MFRSLGAVPVTVPKLELLKTLECVPNVGVLNTSSGSKWNSMHLDSENRGCSNNDKSKSDTPSVLTSCLPELPQYRTRVAGTKPVLSWIPVSIHLAAVGFENSAPPKTTDQAKQPTLPMFVIYPLMHIVYSWPDRKCRMPLNRQPPMIPSATLLPGAHSSPELIESCQVQFTIHQLSDTRQSNPNSYSYRRAQAARVPGLRAPMMLPQALNFAAALLSPSGAETAESDAPQFNR